MTFDFSGKRVLVTGGTVSVLEEPYLGLVTAERFLMPAQAIPARGTGSRLRP